MRRLLTILAAGAALAVSHAASAAPRQAYRLTPGATCDGWPRLPIETAPGTCAGLVVGPPVEFARRTLRLPRTLLPIDGSTWLVTDLGAWSAGHGSIWRLTVGTDRSVRLDRLLAGLSMPHGLARGPDGRVYVGEMSRVFRFDPAATDPAATVETVIADLPDNRLHDNRHPLSQILFEPDGAMIVSVGAPSDQCEASVQAAAAACAESEQTAVLRRYAYLGNGRWSPHPSVLARGLRNSVALARHLSGTLIQAENSYDFAERFTPYDEVNVVRAGANYGWPYCYDRDRATPAWSKARPLDCAGSAHTAPAVLLPPHAAPLSAIYYDGAMFPQLKGRLLMTWHGYRSVGGRVVAFEVDRSGVPTPARKAGYPVYVPGTRASKRVAYGLGPAAEPLMLTPGWGAVAGERPRGMPVGLAVAADGSIWVAEDKNGTIVRIARDRP